jgi:hypothetical protein
MPTPGRHGFTFRRSVLALVGVLLAGGAILIAFGTSIDCDWGIFGPWKFFGKYTILDLDGQERIVRLYYQGPESYAIPPGQQPHLKFVSTSPAGESTFSYETGNRFCLSRVVPTAGGLDVFGWAVWGGGLRFQVQGSEWKVSRVEEKVDSRR